MRIPSPPVRWIIKGILPKGLTLIASKPKVGKSTYAYDAGIAIAEGDMFLGEYPAEQGRVLIVSPDDKDHSRIKERLGRRMQGKPLPDLFQWTFDWRTIAKDDRGFEDFQEYVAIYPKGEVSAIMVDVLPNILPSYREDAQAYQIMYDFLPRFKDWANEQEVAVLALVHKNKSNNTGSGLLDGVYGSVALTAIADNILVIDELPGRQRVLRTAGKNLGETDGIYLHYDRDTERSVVTEREDNEFTREKSARPISARTRIENLLNNLAEDTDMRATSIYDVMSNEYHIKQSTTKGALTDLVTQKGTMLDVEHHAETGLYRRKQKQSIAA